MFAPPAATLAQLQDQVLAAAEKGLAETRSAYAKTKIAAQETVGALETSFAIARAGAVAINAKALELLTANVEANFDFVKSAFGVGGFAELFRAARQIRRALVSTPSPTRPRRSASWRRRPPRDALEPIKAQVAKGFKLPSDAAAPIASRARRARRRRAAAWRLASAGL